MAERERETVVGEVFPPIYSIKKALEEIIALGVTKTMSDPQPARTEAIVLGQTMAKSESVSRSESVIITNV